MWNKYHKEQASLRSAAERLREYERCRRIVDSLLWENETYVEVVKCEYTREGNQLFILGGGSERLEHQNEDRCSLLRLIGTRAVLAHPEAKAGICVVVQSSLSTSPELPGPASTCSLSIYSKIANQPDYGVEFLADDDEKNLYRSPIDGCKFYEIDLQQVETLMQETQLAPSLYLPTKVHSQRLRGEE